jgi:hypothetical protein
MMEHRTDYVASPQQNETGMDKAFGVEAGGHPKNHVIGGIGARRTKRTFRNCRAETVKEGIAATKPIEKALVAHVAARHDGLRTMPGDDLPEAVTDLGERGVPRDRFELTPPLRALPAQRMQDSVRAIDPLFVVLDLYAKTAAREGVVWVAADAYRASIPYSRNHSTGIRTIVRAGAQETVFIHKRLADASQLDD